jgi:flagellar basal body-associated protein FliL
MSTLAIVIILVVVLVIIPNMIIGFVLTKDGLARQKRIAQMKRFRSSVRPKTAGFTDEDRRTVV